ncbi:MAG: hypothetical protein H7A33_02280 [Deltaproteobacteria bacterium]|nr:hypothetical protein [Deltaproteobacteria bacterium]
MKKGLVLLLLLAALGAGLFLQKAPQTQSKQVEYQDKHQVFVILRERPGLVRADLFFFHQQFSKQNLRLERMVLPSRSVNPDQKLIAQNPVDPCGTGSGWQYSQLKDRMMFPKSFVIDSQQDLSFSLFLVGDSASASQLSEVLLRARFQFIDLDTQEFSERKLDIQFLPETFLPLLKTTDWLLYGFFERLGNDRVSLIFETTQSKPLSGKLIKRTIVKGKPNKKEVAKWRYIKEQVEIFINKKWQRLPVLLLNEQNISDSPKGLQGYFEGNPFYFFEFDQGLYFQRGWDGC